ARSRSVLGRLRARVAARARFRHGLDGRKRRVVRRRAGDRVLRDRPVVLVLVGVRRRGGDRRERGLHGRSRLRGDLGQDRDGRLRERDPRVLRRRARAAAGAALAARARTPALGRPLAGRRAAGAAVAAVVVTAAAVPARLLDRVGVHDEPAPVAVLARLAERLDEALAHALARHLHEAERRDLGDLVLGAVAAEALDEATQHEVAVGLEHHVDEVDDDDAADVAQAELADDLLGRLQVVARHGLLERAARARELAGVDVDDRHRLGAVDDERAARGQPDLAVHALRELLVDAVHREAVLRARPLAHALAQVRRELLDVRGDLAPRPVALDGERAEVVVEDVADHADREVGLALEQGGRGRAPGLLLDGLPLPAQALDVGAQLLLARALG